MFRIATECAFAKPTTGYVNRERFSAWRHSFSSFIGHPNCGDVKRKPNASIFTGIFSDATVSSHSSGSNNGCLIPHPPSKKAPRTSTL
ncbi:hypothetical protein NPIL_489071 [Nephila pilipes]|uniref:Uncharacterized protein n=1 Tax=Nephila pilipes TaxID=299642 RepID=A0A8X6MSK0_NEPPI|nr:hypothetical protein NPIL_489071 [Nephila pilipes]